MSTRIIDILSRNPYQQGSLSLVERYAQSPVLEWQVSQVQKSLPQELVGGLCKLLDLMNFGLYGVANVAKAILEGDQNAVQALWRGLTLQEKTTFTDLLKKYGVPYAPVLGFILDVGLDPNTYLNFGIPVFTRAAKTLGVTKAVDKAIDAVKAFSPVDWLGSLFVPGWRTPVEMHTLQQVTKATLSAERAKLLNEIADVLSKVPDDVRKLMAEARLHPERIDEIPEAFKDVFYKYSFEWLDFKNKLVEKGLLPETVSDELAEMYLPGFYEERIRRKFSGAVPVTLLREPSFLKPKRFKTIEEAKEFVDKMRGVLQFDKAEDMIRYLDETFAEGGTAAVKTGVEATQTGSRKAYVPATIDSKGRKSIVRNFDYLPTREAAEQELAAIRGKVNLPLTVEEVDVPAQLYDRLVRGQAANTPLTQALNKLDPDQLSVLRRTAQRVAGYADAAQRRAALAKSLKSEAVESLASMWSKDELAAVTQAMLDGSLLQSIKVPSRSNLGNIARALKEPGLIKNWAQEVIRMNTPIDDFVVLYGLYADAYLAWEARTNFVNTVLERWGKPVPADMYAVPKGYALVLPEGPLRFFPAKGINKKRFEESLAALSDLVAKHGSILEGGRLSKEAWAEVQKHLSTLMSVSSNVKAYLVEEPIARELRRMTAFFSGDEATRKLLKLYDRLLGGWKYTATVLRMPFHIRNAYSNWFMQWLAGMSPVDIVREGLDAIKVQRGTDDVLEGLQWTARELRDMATKMGIRGTGLFGADIKNELLTLEKLYKQGSGTVVGRTVKRVLDAPRQLGALIEDNARISLWLHELRQGKSAEEAARTVWKYLFNYEDITPFERSIKRVVPFYTWLRKNVPLQIEMMLTKPIKYVQAQRAFEALNQLADIQFEERQNLPDWMKHFGVFKLPWKDAKGRQLWAAIDLPAGDIFNRDPSDIFTMVSPLISAVLTAGYGVKAFPPGKPVESYPGELTKAPFWAGWLPRSVMDALGITVMVDYKTGKRVLGWPKKMQEFVYQAVPMARELSNLFPGGGVDVEPEDAPWRRASYLTGIRVTPIDAAEQRLYQELDRRRKMQYVVKRMYQVGRPLTRKELEAILK